MDLIRLDGLDPVGIGVLTRGDDATTGLYTPQRFSSIWRSIGVNLLLNDTVHMAKPIFKVVPSLTKKSIARIEMRVILDDMSVLWHLYSL